MLFIRAVAQHLNATNDVLVAFAFDFLDVETRTGHDALRTVEGDSHIRKGELLPCCDLEAKFQRQQTLQLGHDRC